jgi:hypothetical protein
VQLRQLMEQAGGHESQLEGAALYNRKVLNKWEPWLEGIDNRTANGQRMRSVLAKVYETTFNEMIRSSRMLGEATTTANVGYYAKFVFPALRWAIPNLIANNLVSVQAINSAQANVFYLDWVYDDDKGMVSQGQQFPRDFNRNYSSEYIDGEPIGAGDGVNYGPAPGGTSLGITLTSNPVHRPNAQRGFFVVIRELDAATGDVVQEITVDSNGGFTGDVNGTPTINFSNGAIQNLRFAVLPVNGNAIRAYYHWDSELSSKIPKMKLDVKRAVVQAGIRKIKSLISAEGAMDLREEHGIEAEAELIGISAQEMSLGTDREIIQDLFLASNGTTGTFNRLPPSGVDEFTHLRNIITKFAQVSNTIHTKTLRAPANWMVTSPAIAALLEQFTTHTDYRPIFSSDMDPSGPIDPQAPLTRHGQYQIYRLGTLMSKWVVYVDPFFHNDFCLMGLKGSTYLEAGYAYCPYVPLQIVQPFQNPDNLSIVTAMYTRYAKALLRPDYYGNVRVLNL